MTTDPGVPTPAPEPVYVQWLRLIGALALLIGAICTLLTWTIAPGAKWIAVVALIIFPATALIAAAVQIAQRETHKGRHL